MKLINILSIFGETNKSKLKYFILILFAMIILFLLSTKFTKMNGMNGMNGINRMNKLKLNEYFKTSSDVNQSYGNASMYYDWKLSENPLEDKPLVPIIPPTPPTPPHKKGKDKCI